MSCGFCVELNNRDSDINLMKTILKPHLLADSRIMHETENFVVLPALGSFVEGYVLIVSKEHYHCAGKLPEKAFNELFGLIKKVKRSILTTYQLGSVVFEHGAISCLNKFGGCIDHAHMHVVPCNSSLLSELRSSYCNLIDIHENKALIQKNNHDEPYLLGEADTV